jgi:hypothetical protein
MPLLWWEGGGANAQHSLRTEKDCIFTEYLAWHAGTTFVYNYGLWWRFWNLGGNLVLLLFAR